MVGLQGVEMIVLGYNTPSVNSRKREEGPEKRHFHNRLSVQAGAYQNYAVSATDISTGRSPASRSMRPNCLR